MPRAIRIEKTCENCGATFWVKPPHSHQKFCMRACQRAHEAIHGRPAAEAPVTTFNCKTCGKEFSHKPAYLTEYHRKFGKDPLYCSIPCSAIGRHADTEARNTFVCKQCGKVNKMKRYEGEGRTVYYKRQKFCDQTCKSEYQRSQFHKRFAAGEVTRRIKRGYAMIRLPTKAGEPRRETPEHRWVMEQHLGRPLMSEETVHHIDGNRQNNTLANLELFSSRHGPGQRVIDKVAFAVEMVALYPEFLSPDQRKQLRGALAATREEPVERAIHQPALPL